jgi:phosphate acetyltransferase
MFNLEKSIENQIQGLSKPKPTFVFPEFKDPRILQAVTKLLPFINCMLPCSRDLLHRHLRDQQISFPISEDDFLSQLICLDLSEMIDYKNQFAQQLVQSSQGKKWEISEKQAINDMENPLNFSIMTVREGFANAILGGVQFTSRDYFVPCLRLLKKEPTVFELGLFVLPDTHPTGIFKENIVAFSDVAINLAPDAEALANIVIGSCCIVRDIIPVELLPKINGVIVSYSTKDSGTGPTVDLVKAAGELIPAKLAALQQLNISYQSIQIDWEMQISVAISESAARKKIKNYEHHPAAGQATILTVTNLDFGNSLYHLYATTWPEALKMLQVGGIYHQALDFSRNSTVDDVVLAAEALALQHLKKTDYNGTPNRFIE